MSFHLPCLRQYGQRYAREFAIVLPDSAHTHTPLGCFVLLAFCIELIGIEDIVRMNPPLEWKTSHLDWLLAVSRRITFALDHVLQLHKQCQLLPSSGAIAVCSNRLNGIPVAEN